MGLGAQATQAARLTTPLSCTTLQVIYVDADQILRADLKELWDMDLQGRPYAYTPFCTSREVRPVLCGL